MLNVNGIFGTQLYYNQGTSKYFYDLSCVLGYEATTQKLFLSSSYWGDADKTSTTNITLYTRP